MPEFDDAHDDMMEGTLFRMKLKDDKNHDTAESSVSKNFAKRRPTTVQTAIGSQTQDPAMTYKLPGNKNLTVKATTFINEEDIGVCQVCHHLNPDFVQCNKYNKFSGSWAMREFKDAGKIRSCSFDIPNSKDLVGSAGKGCRYCGLVCTALTKMFPGWESKESFMDVYLAWGLPIILKFNYGTRQKSMPKNGFNPLTYATPDLELESGSPMHFVVDLIGPDTEKEILEIYKSENSPVGQAQCFPGLCHLGFAPERFENLDSGESYNEMKAVIQRCKSGVGEHGICRAPAAVKLPQRLLYLGTQENPTIKLVEMNGSSGLYNTLSYRWGSQQFLKTNKANLKQFLNQIAWKDLPPLFKDAITITRNLGIYHLWIDALCIVQDDKKDWNEQALQMGEIYANSYVTITCASAASPLERILGPRSPVWQSHIFEIKDGKNQAVPLRVRQRSVSLETGERDTNPDHLTTRAWIWQERFLSRRSLVFTNAAMKFECHAGAVWEDQPYPGHSFSARMDKDPRIYWKTLIEDFTQRDITVPTDRLLAIQAVMDKVKERYRLTPISGLWRETITTTLHWGPKEGLHSLEPHASYMAPTWSWASLEGAVDWTIGMADRLPEEDKQWDLKLVDIEYPSPTQPANSHPIRETLVLEGRFVRGTVVRSGGRHAVVFHDSSSFEEFIPEVELVPVDPVPDMEGYHYSTRKRRFGETVDGGDWKGQCGCLLLVRTGQSGTSLVIAPSEEDPRYCERIGILIHHPVAQFLRQPRRVMRIH
jgi:hypothetical protein